MNIMPINNINTPNVQYKAKFSKQDVNLFLNEMEGCDVDAIPKLYTMLEFIKKLPEKVAKILPSDYRPWYQILIDGKSASQGRYYINAYHALQDITVQSNNSSKMVLGTEKMSNETFWKNFYKNNTKTIQDIRNLF